MLPDAIYKTYKSIRDGGVLNYIKTLLLSLFQGLFSKLGFSDTEILLIFGIFALCHGVTPDPTVFPIPASEGNFPCLAGVSEDGLPAGGEIG